MDGYITLEKMIDDLQQFTEYRTTSLLFLNPDHKPSVDSIVVCDQVILDQSGVFSLVSKQGTELWFNSRVDRIQKLRDGYYAIFFEDCPAPFHLCAN